MFLNIYEAPHDPSAVQSFLNWTSTPRTIVIGDFNSVFCVWQPNTKSFYGQGAEVEKWAEEDKLTCLLVDELVYFAGNKIGLSRTSFKDKIT